MRLLVAGLAVLAIAVLAVLAHEPTLASDVTARNGDIELAGTLTIPPGPGPHPAVILVHGSGVVVRSDLDDNVEMLSELGIAVLAFDKRGCGASGGDLLLASFEDLASDVIAARRMLAARSGIDQRRIGVLGISQGGWIGQLAASLDPEIAFVIAVSAPGMSPFEQTLYLLRSELREAGVSADDTHNFVEMVPRWWRYWTTGRNYAELAAAMRAWHDTRAMRVAVAAGVLVDHLVPPEDLPAPDRLRVPPSLRSGRFDPITVLSSIRAPLLFVYGGLDRLVPVGTSVAAIRSELQKTLHPDWQLVVVPDADHGLRVHRGPDVFFRPVFSPAFPSLLRDWLQQHAVVGRRGSGVKQGESVLRSPRDLRNGAGFAHSVVLCVSVPLR